MLFTGESNDRGSWQSPCSISTSKSFYIFVPESRLVFVLFSRIKKAAIHEFLNKSLKNSCWLVLWRSFLLHMRRTNVLCYITELRHCCHCICQASCLSLRLEERKITRLFLEEWTIQPFITKTVNIFLPPYFYREIQAFLSVAFQGTSLLHFIHEFWWFFLSRFCSGSLNLFTSSSG